MICSIAICTYNRVALLKKCLDALLPQVNRDDVEVIVIDNNSKDTTKGLVEGLQKEYSFLKYVFEEKQGLSVARNTAWQQSSATWIAYLDDDGIPHDNYLERLIYVITNFDFDCYGGMYYAYYKREKPRWISENFGTKRILKNDIGLIDNNLLSGGVFNVKRTVLKAVGGFKTAYGMNGNKVGYGEESELQYRIRKAGFKIGFDPLLKIDHLVSDYKLKLSWHLKREYALYRDSPKLYHSYVTYRRIFKTILKSTFYDLPKLIVRLSREEEYFYQNLIFDYLKPAIQLYGTMRNPLLKNV